MGVKLTNISHFSNDNWMSKLVIFMFFLLY